MLPVCKQCERNKSKVDFKPRWLQKTTKGNCSIESCKNPWHSSTNLVSAYELEEVLNEWLVAFSVAEPGTSIGLCREHYNAWYTRLHTSQQCASCGAKPKRGETFTRHIPKPDFINTHMENISEDHQQLQHDSCICLTCYKYFHSIICQIEQKQDTECPEGSSLASVFTKLSICMASLTGHDLAVSDYRANGVLDS